jgi:hypothetical protein
VTFSLKLSIHTSNILTMRTLLSIFLRTLLMLLLCVECPPCYVSVLI